MTKDAHSAERTLDATAIAELVGQAAPFALLSPEERRTLAASARIVRCRGRTQLYCGAITPTQIFYVVNGGIELSASNPAGDEVVLAVYGPENWATWLILFDDTPTGRALTGTNHSVVLAFPAETLRGIIARNPALYPPILAEISRRFRATLRWQAIMSLRNGPRVAQLLAMLIEVNRDTGYGVVMATHNRLARMLGLSRQTLHVELERLAQSGIITRRYGRIEVPDPARLQALDGHH